MRETFTKVIENELNLKIKTFKYRLVQDLNKKVLLCIVFLKSLKTQQKYINKF